MGSFLSGVLGTNSAVDVNSQNPYAAIQPWQQQAQQLAGQLQQQAAGGGPNPAQLQLQQNVQNIAQQQANQYAANRSLSPEAAARLAGQNAAQMGSQAAGQSAILQAQQQLAAQGQLGNLYSQQQQALNQAGTINAQIAGANQQQASGIVGGLMQGLAGAGGALLQGNGISGVGQALGSLATGAKGADGGFVEKGQIKPPHLQAIEDIYYPHMAKGGKVKALLSPGEKYLSPKEAKEVAVGDKKVNEAGHKIPGKAKVEGDSLKNDIVPANLEEGGIVIPRSIMNSKNPEKEAAKFIAKALSEHGKSPEGEFRGALKRAIAGRKTK
jgi:hypothetical protein